MSHIYKHTPSGSGPEKIDPSASSQSIDPERLPARRPDGCVKLMRLLSFLSAIALAATSSSAAENQWDFTATLYGWFPSVSTAVETPLGEVEGQVDFDEILETLDIAFIGALEARKGRLSLVADLQYFDIGVEAEPHRATSFNDAKVDSQMFLFSAYASYALVDSAKFRLDIGGGLRFIGAKINTHLYGKGAVPVAEFSADGHWTDALIVTRVRRQFNDRWHGVAYFEVGGFGIGDSSDLTWQVFAGGGYRLNAIWSAVGGFRHLAIERRFGNFDVTTEVSGPLLGFQAAF